MIFILTSSPRANIATTCFINSLFLIKSSPFTSNPNPSHDLEPWTCFIFTLTCIKCSAFTFRFEFPLFFNSLFFIRFSFFTSNPNLDLEPWPYSISTLTCAKGVVSTFRSKFPLRCCSFPCFTCKHVNKIALGTRSSRKDCSSSSMCFGSEDLLVKDCI